MCAGPKLWLPSLLTNQHHLHVYRYSQRNTEVTSFHPSAVTAAEISLVYPCCFPLTHLFYFPPFPVVCIFLNMYSWKSVYGLYVKVWMALRITLKLHSEMSSLRSINQLLFSVSPVVLCIYQVHHCCCHAFSVNLTCTLALVINRTCLSGLFADTQPVKSDFLFKILICQNRRDELKEQVYHIKFTWVNVCAFRQFKRNIANFFSDYMCWMPAGRRACNVSKARRSLVQVTCDLFLCVLHVGVGQWPQCAYMFVCCFFFLDI